MRRFILCCCLPLLFACAVPTSTSQAPALNKSDHYVSVKSVAPGMKGGEAKIYVRELSLSGASDIPAARRVVLFVHGAGTPAEVSFGRAPRRLQLDGVPRQRGLRRIRHGHDGLRALDASGPPWPMRAIFRRRSRRSSFPA